jgi:transcriptional regulator with XRE-family HTH domain
MSNSEKISAGKRAFGERVRQFRMDRDRDWSQDDLARESHLSQSEISKIEKASYSREPSEETIRKIAKAFEIKPVDLARGTPFAALFAQSEVLAVGSRTEGPAVMAYFASALTNLSSEQSAEIIELDEKVDGICTRYERHPLILYRPRTKTSPTDNPDVTSRDVYNIDRGRVASSDLLILAGIFPSLGAGMELQLALQSCTSVLLLIKENQILSRMVTGCPIRKRVVKYENLSDLEVRLPEALDALLPHVADFRFATSSDQKHAAGLGDRIRQYREHRGLTEKDLARMVGVGTPYIEDLESMTEQVTNPSLLILRRLASALNLAEGFLITGHETPIQFQNPIFADHLKYLDLYSSEVRMPVDEYKDLWKQHVDRYALELSITGADRRVEIGDRKYWIDKHDALKRDNKKGLFPRPNN